MDNTKEVKKQEDYFNTFAPPADFKVPALFPIMRGRSVLIRKDSEGEQLKKSGIIIPETAKDKAATGRVYAVGPEVKWLSPGMKVVHNYFANQFILDPHTGIEYLMMADLDVFCILPEGFISGNEQKEVEGRKQYSVEEMPEAKATKEEIQEAEENAQIGAEILKKDATVRHIAVDGQGGEK